VIEQTIVGLLVLDVADVDFVSSGGLAMLVTAARAAERWHKRFAVVTGDQQGIPRALHIAGLDRSVSHLADPVRRYGQAPGTPTIGPR
jgi:anti-anti-sigma factor